MICLVCFGADLAFAQNTALSIGNYQVISRTRVGRLEDEFKIKADLTNTGPALTGITATVASTPPETSAAKPTLNFAAVPTGAPVTSSDTFTIIQDRTKPFDPTGVVWTFSSLPSAPTIAPLPSPTKLTTIAVTGTARPNTTVEIGGGTALVTTTATGAGTYSANVALQQNRVNKLHVTAIAAPADRSAPASADVVQDLQGPSVFLDFPTAGAALTNDTITVAGRVGDMLSGFAGLTVTVNGQPANVDVGIGNNGTFERAGVPLTIGANNPIIVVATDINGNATTLPAINVTRVPLTGLRMVVSSGDMQLGGVHRALAAPIGVQVLNADGTPFAGKLVTFNVTRSDGRLKNTPVVGTPGTMLYQTHTNASGLATAYWTLGGDAGCGNNRVTVTSKDIAGTITFCASAAPGPLSQINIGSGNDQRVETNAPAPDPLRAWVSDSCNGIEAVPITFTVVQGGGKVNGRNSVTVDSGRTGHAQVTYLAGPDAGNQIVEANYPNNLGSPATFVTYGIQRDPNLPTSFTGLVLDNTSQPIGHAFCSLVVGGATQTTFSDIQGRFAFTGIPAGRADFFVSGATATSLGGAAIPANSFPFLTFFFTLVPNAENSLPKPVLLPRLNTANNVTYNGTTDLVLTCQGMEGLKMTIKANSMRKADGSLVTPSNTAVVSLNQVHHDDVPMPIPDGAAPPFTWTLQPGRATFNPPIQIEYPNMSGLPAGTVAYFLSFNHDTERFDIIASGHVTDDGSTIVTDAGGGLSIAGWGCNCPPYSVTANCKKDDLCDAAKKLHDDYVAKQNTASAALAHQLDCLGREASGDCQTPPPWTDSFVGDVVKDIANHRSSGNSPADAVCSRIPIWLSTVIRPGGVFGAIFNLNDVCALAGGIFHFKDELEPSFERRMKDALDRGITKDQIRRDHKKLTDEVIPRCFSEVGELSPIPRAIAQAGVPPVAGLLRESTLSALCAQSSSSATFGQASAALAAFPQLPDPLPKGVLFSDALDNTGTLRVSSGNTFFLRPGQTAQLSVIRRADGRDVSGSVAGSQYFAAVGDGSVTVTAEGLVEVHYANYPLPSMTPVFYVYVGNGDDFGVGQFAVTDVDTDGDLIVDSYELRAGLNPAVPNSLVSDVDGDGITDLSEAVLGTSPIRKDTDLDGVFDNIELKQGSDPLDPNSKTPALRIGARVAVGGQAATVGAGGRIRIPNISAADQFGAAGPGSRPDFVSDDFVRVSGTEEIDGKLLYVFSDPFQFTRGQTFEVTDLVVTDTPPPLPERLRIVADNPTLTTINQTTQLHVFGVLKNGSEVDVTPRLKWTVYRTSSPNVVTVGPDGLVTARSAGAAYVTAVNDGATAVARIFAIPGDPLTTLEGFVRFEDGTPVSGANISLFALPQTAVAGADGHFVMPNVPTQATSSLTVRATVRIGTQDFVGTGAAVVPVPAGLTDAGVITVKPGGGRLGPIIVSGMDPEDHGTPGQDMIRDIMNFVVKNSAVHQAPSKIVMFGGTTTTGNSARALATGLGFTLTQVNGAGITTTDLNPLTTPYDAVYMPTTEEEIGGGLSQADLNLVNARSASLITFVNKGGGLASFAQNLTGGYAWFPLGGLTTVNLNSEGNTSGITVTADGAFILSSTATAVQPFHQGFTGPAGFFGLKVLARQTTGLQRALIVGGLADIAVGPAPVLDSDGDGIPDSYELAQGLNPVSAGDAGVDADGDGWTNLQEYLAGTNPHNSRDALRITSITRAPVDVQINFTSVPGKSYRIECSTDLTNPQWSTLIDRVLGTGEILTGTDPRQVPVPACFYRVVLLDVNP